jgi:hypothetical protein
MSTSSRVAIFSSSILDRILRADAFGEKLDQFVRTLEPLSFETVIPVSTNPNQGRCDRAACSP